LPTDQNPHKLLEMCEIRNKGLISAPDFSAAFIASEYFSSLCFWLWVGFAPLLSDSFVFISAAWDDLSLPPPFMPKATGFDTSPLSFVLDQRV